MVGEPQFFVDRSLGRRRLPEGLRSDGWVLHTLAEVYGVPTDEAVADVGTARWNAGLLWIQV